jgi:hypothetical protein
LAAPRWPSLVVQEICRIAGAVRRLHSVVVTRLVRDCALGRVTQYSRGLS